MIDLPKFNEFFTPILQVVSKTGEINAHEAVDLVIKSVGLNEEQLSLKQESNGRPLAKNRVHWACSYLYKAGGLTRPKRGFIDVGVNTNHFLNLKRPVDLRDIRSTNEWKQYEEEKANRILLNTNNSANIYSSFQFFLYVLAIIFPLIFIYYNKKLDNLTLANNLERVNDFIIRFGFWSVLIIGITVSYTHLTLPTINWV